MFIRTQCVRVFIVLLFLFFSMQIDVFAVEPSEEAREKGGMSELSVMSGWAWGDLKRQDDYEMVPLYVQCGFDIKPLFKKINIDPPGNIRFLIEPFINGVVSPDSNAETGVNFLLKYSHPFLEKLHLYAEGGAGFLYTTQHTYEQATQFNFSEQFGAGFSLFFSENKSFNIGYRYRHFSNAGIEEPNAGVDMRMILTGISIYY